MFFASGRTDWPFEVEGQLFDDLHRTEIINQFWIQSKLFEVNYYQSLMKAYLETITPPHNFDRSCSTSAIAFASNWLSALDRSLPEKNQDF